MNFDELFSISPIDGRYKKQTYSLSKYFSEYALTRWRIYVEVEYFCQLFDKKIISDEPLDDIVRQNIKGIYSNFNEDDCIIIKKLEKELNHDVKAVEYFIKSKIESLGLGEYKEFVHFGITSQDINNTAIPLMIRKWFENIYLVDIDNIIEDLITLSENTSSQTMLARTHGQPASTTNMGKEISVFIERLQNQVELIKSLKFYGKFGGATGNFNAHKVAYPNVNWEKFSDEFTASIGLKRLKFTTQIEHYDNLSALFDNLKRINVILLDFCKDMWQYISMEYFTQKAIDGEIGSSAMPHKVNPIDFENAEGNLGISNALLHHFSEKLPISRLQRDLSDSTVLRNVGVPMSHIKISFNSIRKGISKLSINKIKIDKELDENWAIISEGIQTILRREKYPKPYESLKQLTRGKNTINKEDIWKFIDGLNISDELKYELKSLTPQNYYKN